jgi:hypothetical protein
MTHPCNYVDYKWTIGKGCRFFKITFQPAISIVASRRTWFNREARSSKLHPAVVEMMTEHYCPTNWEQLLLEWPHKSKTDANRVAYTRDERSGEADRQTITTVGKYLTRHFTQAPDHLVRDLVAKHTLVGGITITQDPDEMLRAIMHGPSSCMSKDFSIRCEDGVHRHPYAVYDPALGWGMAVRTDDGEILGRALVFTPPDDPDSKVFVRSYKRDADNSSYSGVDEAIEAILQSQGFSKDRSWPDGTPIRAYRLQGGGEYLMPYIDGGDQNVTEPSSDDIMTIDSDGEIDAAQTGGTACVSERYTCQDCGNRVDEDDIVYVGRSEDHCVCDSCRNRSYTFVTGRNGAQYYVDDNDSVCVDGDQYHADYLNDNGIVELHDGEYARDDDTVYIESVSEYYRSDDLDVCYDEFNGRHELREDCVELADGDMCHVDNAWQCKATGNYYDEDTDHVEIDGEMYHPDDAPESTQEELFEADEDETEATPALATTTTI